MSNFQFGGGGSIPLICGGSGGSGESCPKTKNKESGGPAFPNFEAVGQVVLTTGGMTLRDYFTAKASDGDIERVINDFWMFYPESDQPSRAQARFMNADEMLAAREVVQ